jgi:NADH-quinone oxidoreductase subunit H
VVDKTNSKKIIDFTFVLVGVVLLLLYAVLALFYIYFERKVCAFFQCRLGPNRVGPYGIIQSVADMFKILIKELITLNHIDKFLFNLAPYLVIVASMLAFGCLPFGRGLQVIDFNIGVFFLIAVSSIGVLGIFNSLKVQSVNHNKHHNKEINQVQR